MSLKLLQFGSANGQMASNCFFLITGYFMNKKQKFSFKPLGKLIITTIFYSYLIFIIVLIINPLKIMSSCGILEYLKILFPIICRQWWFVSAYVGLYLIIPYINKLIEIIKESEFRKLLVILLLLTSVFPTVFFHDTWMSDFTWAITLYLIGAYVDRFYNKFDNIKSFWWALVSTVGMFILGMSVVVLNMLPYIMQKLGSDLHFRSMNQIPCIVTSIAFFIWSTKWKLKSVVVNRLAKFSLSVYLIHTNIILQQIIWKKLAHLRFYLQSPEFTAIALVVIPVTIYLICAVLDYIREIFFNTIGGLLWKRKA